MCVHVCICKALPNFPLNPRDSVRKFSTVVLFILCRWHGFSLWSLMFCEVHHGMPYVGQLSPSVLGILDSFSCETYIIQFSDIFLHYFFNGFSLSLSLNLDSKSPRLFN